MRPDVPCDPVLDLSPSQPQTDDSITPATGAGSHAGPEPPPLQWDWVLGGILIAFIVLDVALVLAKRPTISQRLKHADRRRPWIKWLTAGAMILGWLHFFQGVLWN